MREMERVGDCNYVLMLVNLNQGGSEVMEC